MLKENDAEYTYREYTKEPLTEDEVRDVVGKLGVPAHTLLRSRDAAYKTLALSGKEDDATLIPHFAAHPTLMQRPIVVSGDKAVVGRPVENILTLL